MDGSLNRLSAVDAAAALAAGETTAEALTTACLERIDAREAEVGAWIHLDPEQALTEARVRDQAGRPGPLHGLPVGIKDLVDTADMPTGYGSPIYDGHQPAKDADSVKRLRAAGAVILGKTVTTEFAVFNPGKTRNPHDLSRTPGGSSSGSAAAVADFMVPLAVGSQTAGSVIRPAAFCGVVGFKPSYGSIDLTGMHDCGPSLDTLGVFGRSVADVALIGQALGKPDSALAAVDPAAVAGAKPAVGLCRTGRWDQAEPALRSALESVAGELGATATAMPPGFDDLFDVQNLIMWDELSKSLATERAEHGEKLSDKLRELIDWGAGLPAAEVAAARDKRADCMARVEDLFGADDVLITPASAGEAPAAETTGDPMFNRIWTLLHVPCVTLPIGAGPNGLPLAVQVVARIGEDARLLAAAKWIERKLSR